MGGRPTRRKSEVARGPRPPADVQSGMPLKAGEMKRKVEKVGWVYSHTTGSHAHYRHPTIPGIVTIPGADHVELAKGTEANVKRQAGIK